MFGKTDSKCNPVWLFLGKCFCFLALGHDYFQMVVGRIFTELFFKIGPSVILSQNRELGILQINIIALKGCDLIFIHTDIDRIALMVEVAHGMQLF